MPYELSEQKSTQAASLSRAESGSCEDCTFRASTERLSRETGKTGQILAPGGNCSRLQYRVFFLHTPLLQNWRKHREIGLGLIGFGLFFTFLAVILFFDRGLLALGNIFWLAGVAILLGWRSTLQLFTDRRNYKGSGSFLLGIFLIFVRWPVVGIIVELYGCILLFRGFWPSIKAFLYQIPVIGWILQYPALLWKSSA